MVKFAHLLVLSIIITWIAGSGCIGNDPSDVGNGGVTQKASEAGNADNSEMELTPAEIQELNTDMAELEKLLESASVDEKIEMEIEE